MPENYYCFDNFFQKMTNLESPRKNNDCYFYYYSTCIKGDSCTFRHEPLALGCETTCSFWKEGKCVNVHCNFRHMELRKNRKTIPCYWESQPGGCKKPHCPFLHTAPKAIGEEGETSELSPPIKAKEADVYPESCNKKVNQVDSGYGGVDATLVVKFEEESDNESTPAQSPIKTQRVVKIKTLEEIRLERIQAESAAYYSYSGNSNSSGFEPEDVENLRSRILQRFASKQSTSRSAAPVKILTLDEIRKRRQRNAEAPLSIKRTKVSLTACKPETVLDEIKIKTLSEIKAERSQNKRKAVDEGDGNTDAKISKLEEENEVSSTSRLDDCVEMDEPQEKIKCVVPPVVRKLKSPVGEEESEVKVDEKSRDKADDGVDDVKADHSSPHSDSKLDELLLEDDDMESATLSLRDEEDILKDIDNLLNE